MRQIPIIAAILVAAVLAPVAASADRMWIGFHDDPVLRYDEATKNWISGPIDWDEFFQVIKGNGPCNRERLEARRKAHEDGAWVREAAVAHAKKGAARSAA